MTRNGKSEKNWQWDKIVKTTPERKTGSGWSKQCRNSETQSIIHLNELTFARLICLHSAKNWDANASKKIGDETLWLNTLNSNTLSEKRLKIWQNLVLKWAKCKRFVAFYFWQTLLLNVLDTFESSRHKEIQPHYPIKKSFIIFLQ